MKLRKVTVTVSNHTFTAELTSDELEHVIEFIRIALRAAQARSITKCGKEVTYASR